MWKKGMNQSSELDGFHEDEQSGKVFSEAGAGVTDMDVQGYIHVVDASKAVGDMEPMSTGFDKLSYAKMVAKNPAVTDNSSLSTGLPMDDVIVLEEDYIIYMNAPFPSIKFSDRVHNQRQDYA
ncbi:hypothetical protein V6N11_022139 [Hibiscus sabdariffa]|uniref:Uncharacterized protein n=1 Tax=Hibiscus sabdariffa TaxID=183260 RepID=A0ABR2TIW6_9ROSI